MASSDLKTINGESIVGTGNISIQPGTGGISSIKFNSNMIVEPDANGVADIGYPMSAYQLALKSTSVLGTINGQQLTYGGSVTIPTSEGTTTYIENPYDINNALGYTTTGTNYAVQIANGKLYVNVPSSGTSGTVSVKSLTLDDNGTVALTGTGSIYVQGLDGIQTKENNGAIQLYLSEQFKTDMNSALTTALSNVEDIASLEERIEALEGIEPGEGGPSVYLKSITKSGNTYTIKDQANTETSWTIPTVPTVNNAAITFAIAGEGNTIGGTINLNQSGNQTIYLPAGGNGETTYIENPFEIGRHSISELSDGSDFVNTVNNHSTAITAHDRQLYVTKEENGEEVTLSRIDLLEQALADLPSAGISSIKFSDSLTITPNGEGVADVGYAMSGYQTKLKSTDTIGTINGQALKYGGTITIPTDDGLGDTVHAHSEALTAIQGEIYTTKDGQTVSRLGVIEDSITSTNNVLATYMDDVDDLETAVGGKQDTLVSGTNIKTINGNSILGEGNITVSGGATTLGGLTDVSTATPTSGQVLKYNGTQWAPATDNTSSSTMNLDDIDDVSASDASDGQVLMYYAGDWLNRNIVLNEIGDVDTTGATNGQVLKYDGSKWAPAADNAGSSTTATPTVYSFDVNPNSLNTYTVNGTTFKGFNIDFPLTENTYANDCGYPVRVDVQYFSTNYDRTDSALGSFVISGGLVYNSTTHYGWKNVYDTFNDGDTVRISAGANVAGDDVIVKYINPAPGVYDWSLPLDSHGNKSILFPIGLKVEDYGNVQIKVTVSGSFSKGNVTVDYTQLDSSDKAIIAIANKLS